MDDDEVRGADDEGDEGDEVEDLTPAEGSADEVRGGAAQTLKISN